MEIAGKIVSALEPKSGVSKSTGKLWKVAQYVLETQEAYPKHVLFEVFGEDRLQQFNIQVGEEVTVAFDIDAREYNGKWYNQLKAWKVDRTSNVSPTPTVAQLSSRTENMGVIPPYEENPFEQQEEIDKLPF